MLLSTGERISCALMAMALHDLGHDARSFTGLAGRASSPTPRTPRPRSSRSAPTACARPSSEGHIVLVAGFQGVSTDRNVTTLGRGGSDTTAVALAAALERESARSTLT